MAPLRVNRWSKHGHDRLYVSTQSGLKVGWMDLRTQQRRLQMPGMWPDFEAAVNRWRAEHPGWQQVRQAPPGQQAGVRPPGADLSQRKAGHNAAVIAQRLRPGRGVRVLAGLLGVRTRDRSWRVGAAGERAVGAKLARLERHGWRVLHGIDLGGGGDVDHLLIGPGGVQVVNTKHHPRARVRVGRRVVFVRGQTTQYIGKARREAERVTLALVRAWGRPIHIAPVLVVHGHRRLSGWLWRRPLAVQVLPSWALRWWYRLPGKAHLSPRDIEELYALARCPTTWNAA